MTWLTSAETVGHIRGLWRRPATISLAFVALTILAVCVLLYLPE